MRNKLLVMLISLVIVFSFFSPKNVFAADDITGHYFEFELRSLIQKEIMGGYSNGNYRPDNVVTRAEFTSLLVKSLKLPGKTTNNSFTDIKEEDWYTWPITVATSHNLIGGYPDGTFKPNNKISRQEMAAMLQRALVFKGISSRKEELKFDDTADINEIFRPSIEKLLYHGIMSGKGNNKFAPKDHTTRGETAAVINRMLNRIANPTVIISSTDYKIDYNKMLDIQMTKTPKLDGAGKYIASRALVSYYANPRNFNKESSDFLQFLDLSQSTGFNATEVNNKVLAGKGKLAGQATAFLKAGSIHNINEIYLIAHALHETGNGTSKLAKGVTVDKDGNIVSPEQAKYTVYNFFGYGAVDSNALRGGAKYAFDRKWFTPQDAIIGGAADIANNYVNDGQNTLYKMRWNPDSPGYPQYATHVMWAVLQTKRMSQIYDLLDSYVLKFDIPNYINQPQASAKPTGVAQYHVNTKLASQIGITNATTLNIRSGPTTNFNKIGSIPNGAKVTIVGENGGWYKMKYSGTVGWVSGKYIILEKDLKISSINKEESVKDTSDADKVNDKQNTTSPTTNETPDNEEQVEAPNSQEDELQEETDVEVNNIIGKTNEEKVKLLSSPNTSNNFSVIKELVIGTTLEIVEQQDDWYKVIFKNDKGWVHMEQITINKSSNK